MTPAPDPTPALLRVVEVMDRLRSPGGCPWDAVQTHRSLTRYLLEETYEVIEAIESGDAELLREELGDLLLQVLFHARIANEAVQGRFDIEDVAADLADKLVRRHPHVFAGADSGDADQLNETWEQQKIAEKGRTSAVDGVPIDQPSLALAAKLVSRARRAGLDVADTGEVRNAGDVGDTRGTGVQVGAAASSAAGPDVDAIEAEFGARLLALAAEAVSAGVDPETALRRRARGLRDSIMAAEVS